MLSGLSVLLAEGWILKLFLDRTLDPAAALVLHLAMSGMLLLWAFSRAHQNKKAILHFLLAIFTAFLGPVGTAGFFLTSVFYFLFNISPIPVQEYFKTLFPVLKKNEVEKMFDQMACGHTERFEQNSVVPFIDILRYGNQRQKQAMIVLLINNFHAKFASVLKEALNDKDNSIKVLAAMGMTQIENSFTERGMEIGGGMEDPEKIPPDVFKSLGLHLDEYAYSGILDETQRRNFQERSIHAYEKYLSNCPHDHEIGTKLGRALLRTGRYEESAKRFEEAMHHGGQSVNLLTWELECLYRQGQYEKLRRKAARHFDELSAMNESIPDEIHRVLMTWGRPEPASHSRAR